MTSPAPSRQIDGCAVGGPAGEAARWDQATQQGAPDVTLRLPLWLLSKARRRAAREGVGVHALLRRLVEEGLRDEP